MNVDYLLKLKTEKSLTNEQIADLSGVPMGTIVRILSGRTDNPYFSTIIDIVRAMDGSVDVMENLQPSENAIRYDSGDRERWLRFLVGIILGIFVLLVGMVLYDALSPMRGWIRH